MPRNACGPQIKLHPLYNCWLQMRARCRNKNDRNYRHYGGRGISVCERWHKFGNFIVDMGLRPAGMELDRIDNDGNYEPSNCRWATRTEQCRNMRKNKYYEVNGVRRWVQDIEAELGLGKKTIHYRLKRGWSVQRACTEPKR